MSKHFRVPGRLSAKLNESGIRASSILQHAGLPQGLLDQPRILVTTEELFALWRGIGQISPDPAIGLALGTETKREHFDPIALAALSTGSFGEAMRQMARYKQLTCPEEIVHEADEAEWSIQFRWLLADGVEPEVLTDLCFAYVLSISGASLWLPHPIWSRSQCHRFPRFRRHAAFHNPQRRTSGHACAAARRRTEAT
jgi:hypothetical protein